MNAIETLRLELEEGRYSHAYLFIGSPENTSALVELVISSLNCKTEDISLIESTGELGKSGEIKIDQIRDLLHFTSLTPNGQVRLAIIKDCEKLNASSGNILLKKLEEPGKSAIFILTAQSFSILPTIRSRCRLIEAGFGQKENSEDLLKSIKNSNFAKASLFFEEIIKKELVGDFFEEIKNFFQEKLEKEKTKETAGYLEEILKAEKDIARNGNARLVLEDLYLITESALK